MKVRRDRTPEERALSKGALGRPNVLEIGGLGYPWGPAHKGKLGALRRAPAKKRKERPVS